MLTTVGFGLLVGKDVVTRPLKTADAGFLDDILFLFGYPSGSRRFLIDGSLRMRHCSANFSLKKPTWGLPHSGGVAVLVSAVDAHQSVVGGLSGSGAALSLGNVDNGGRRKIRLTKKTNVRKRFGVDPWGQPIPKRWRANTFGSVVGYEGGIFCSGNRLSHVDEPKGNWLIIRLHSPTPPGEVHVGAFQ